MITIDATHFKNLPDFLSQIVIHLFHVAGLVLEEKKYFPASSKLFEEYIDYLQSKEIDFIVVIHYSTGKDVLAFNGSEGDFRWALASLKEIVPIK